MTRIFFVLDPYGNFDTMCMSKWQADTVCDYGGTVIKADVAKVFDRPNQQCYYCKYCRKDKHDVCCSKGYMIDLPFPCEEFEEIVKALGFL